MMRALRPRSCYKPGVGFGGMAMRPIWIILSAVLALASVSPAQAQDAAARYQALLADAKAGKPVDWQALRFADADSPGFSAVGAGDLHKQMAAAFQAGDFKSAAAVSKQISDADFVDVGAHIFGDLAAQKLGDQAGAAREHQIAAGLLRSIMTGDGLSKAGAFTVIRVDEEYVLMGVIHMKVRKQSLITGDGGHSYDILDVVDEKGGEHTYYFQIDRALAAEAALLKH